MQLQVADVEKVLPSSISANLNKIVNTRIHKQYPCYYTVGDRVHYSDIKAFQDFSKNLKDELFFNVDMDMFWGNPDWTVEPPQSIEYYRQQVCNYIKDTYKHVILGYSGGTDSETVADAFKRSQIKNVTFLHTALVEHMELASKQWLFKHMREHIKRKHSDAIRDLNWNFRIAEQWQVNSYKHFSNDIADNLFGVYDVDFRVNQAWKQNSGSIVIPTPTKNTILIMGKEKPEIVINDGWWCFHMISSYFEQPFAAIDQDIDTFCFFLNDAVPELQIKLAWTKAKEMEKIFIEQNIKPTRENSFSVSSPGSNYYNRIISKMEYRAISKFLNSNSSKFGGEYHKLITSEYASIDKNAKIKQEIADKFFDEVLIDTIDHRFLKFNNKSVHGICSKPIKLFPVDKKLYQSK